MKPFVILLAFAALAAATMTLAAGPSSAAPSARFDCILIAYSDGQEQNAKVMGERLAEEFNGERVITYPDSFVAIVVPKSKLAALQKQLKSEMCVLRPGLK